MTTKHAAKSWSHLGGTLSRLVSSSFFLALLVGQSSLLHAEERLMASAQRCASDAVNQAVSRLKPSATSARVLAAVATIDPDEEKLTVQPIAPSIANGTIDLVGPSAEAIHAVLYPEIKGSEVGIPGN